MGIMSAPVAFGLTLPTYASRCLSTTVSSVEIDPSGSINVYFTSSSECGSRPG